MERIGQKDNFIAKHAKIATVVAVIFGSTSGILGNLITAPALAIGFWRLAIALPFFIIPAVADREKRHKLKGISKKTTYSVLFQEHFFSAIIFRGSMRSS